jgi:heme/copper-type cytochrome/quinol oxidase subunit 2
MSLIYEASSMFNWSRKLALLALLDLAIIGLPTFTIGTAALAGAAASSDSATADLRFENHRFRPETLTLPGNQPLVIKVVNASQETIEFESFKLNREVAMSPGQTIRVRLPALSPGKYDFYDDFHQDVREGVIIAK